MAMWDGRILAGLPASARWYLKLTGAWDKGQRLLDSLIIGTFLGLMDERALAALDEAVYATVDEKLGIGSARYDHPDHIRSGLTPWERDLLERHAPAGTRLLITSAGGGREVLGALTLGYDAVGYEPHRGLVAAGDAVLTADGHPGRLHRCARDAFPRTAPAADAILVGWGSYSHIAPSTRRVAFLKDARERLPYGAPLLLSFWMLLGRERQLGIVYGVARCLRRLRRLPPPERGDILMPHFGHAFSPAELRRELAAAGFSLEQLTGTPYPHAVARAV